MVPAPLQTNKAELTEDEQHEKEIDNLLLHLVDMLRVAVERTEISYWDWKKEDDGLKVDIAAFNKSLKTSLNLVSFTCEFEIPGPRTWQIQSFFENCFILG